MRVSVVIPVWNVWEMTETCLRALAEHGAGENFEVVVVDNGSTDATAHELEPLGQALFEERFLSVRLPTNMGFAVACNLGAQAGRGELLFFLNNDTVPRAGWLPPLREVFADSRVGATGPLLLYPSGTVQHCGIAVTPLNRLGHLYEDFPGDHPVTRRKRPLQALTGAALMVRENLFAQCGGFHEGFVNGGEDVDLCCALRGLGYKLILAPESVIVHHTSATPGRFDKDKENAQLLFERRKADIRPDIHVLAALDGYEARLSPMLFSYLALPDERERALNTAFDAKFGATSGTDPDAAFDEAACREQLVQEPLWLGGRMRLMSYFEAKGRLVEALNVGMEALSFFPLPEIQARLLGLARQLSRVDLVPAIMRALVPDTLGMATTSDMSAAQLVGVRRKYVKKIRQEAKASGDEALVELLGQWLINNGA